MKNRKWVRAIIIFFSLFFVSFCSLLSRFIMTFDGIALLHFQTILFLFIVLALTYYSLEGKKFERIWIVAVCSILILPSLFNMFTHAWNKSIGNICNTDYDCTYDCVTGEQNPDYSIQFVSGVLFSCEMRISQCQNNRCTSVDFNKIKNIRDCNVYNNLQERNYCYSYTIPKTKNIEECDSITIYLAREKCKELHNK